jgi:hypothetical protein
MSRLIDRDAASCRLDDGLVVGSWAGKCRNQIKGKCDRTLYGEVLARRHFVHRGAEQYQPGAPGTGFPSSVGSGEGIPSAEQRALGLGQPLVGDLGELGHVHIDLDHGCFSSLRAAARR